MSEAELDQNLAETVEESNESVENTEQTDDNSIRALLESQLGESDDQPTDSESKPPETPEPGAETPTEPEEIAPPQSWTEEERAIWQDLPPSARDAIQRTEKAYQSGLRMDAEVSKVLEPLNQQLDGSGVHVDQYLQQLLQADQFITNKPLEAALTMIQNHGLADQIVQHLNAPQPQQALPQDDATAHEVAELRAQLQYQNEVNAAAREWDSFVRDHPDAEQLSKVIAAEIQSNPSYDYAKAYEAAKETIQGFSGQQAQLSEAETISKATQASAKAKALNLPKGKTDTHGKPQSTGNLRDDIAETLRAAGYR